jgi:hypothetical protein
VVPRDTPVGNPCSRPILWRRSQRRVHCYTAKPEWNLRPPCQLSELLYVLKWIAAILSKLKKCCFVYCPRLIFLLRPTAKMWIANAGRGNEKFSELQQRLQDWCDLIQNTPAVFEHVRQSLMRRVAYCVEAGQHFEFFFFSFCCENSTLESATCK